MTNLGEVFAMFKVKALRRVVLGSSALLPFAAFGAPPVAFNSSYALNPDGTISYTCPTGFTCDANPISEAGIYQVQITEDATGNTFYHTIVAEDGAAGTFASENFDHWWCLRRYRRSADPEQR